MQKHVNRETGVKATNFQVLRETKMTAILEECGFMTNKEEAKLLKSDSYRKKGAQAIVKDLINQYKRKRNQQQRRWLNLRQLVNSKKKPFQKRKTPKNLLRNLRKEIFGGHAGEQ